MAIESNKVFIKWECLNINEYLGTLVRDSCKCDDVIVRELEGTVT